MHKMKIGDILKETDKLHLQIQPRLEGALSDQNIIEIQDMMDTIGIMPEGSQAQIIALEGMIKRKNPELGITRQDFLPAAPEALPAGQVPEGTESTNLPNIPNV